MRASVHPSLAQRLGLILVLLAAFALRLQELTRQDIWWDEARNIDVALRPLWQIAGAPELDIQPPLYYWLLHGWSALFGLHIGQPAAGLALAARLLSVFAGVIGVALLVPLARRALPKAHGARTGASVAALLAALTGAVSPFWLAESQEARMYTVGFALLTAAALALLHYIGRGGLTPAGAADSGAAGGGRRVRGDVGTLALFAGLAAAALLTHYNAVFVLVTWFVWWGVWALLRADRWRQVAALIAAGLGMSLLVLPILPIALRQIPEYENPNITIPSLGDYLAQNWRAYAGGYAFDPALLGGNGALWLWLLLGVAAGGVGIALWQQYSFQEGAGENGVRRDSAAPSRKEMAHPLTRSDTEFLRETRYLHPLTRSPAHPLTPLTFLLAWLLGGLALYYVAVLDRNAFNVRYASFVTPALYALIGVGLAAYGQLGRWGRWGKWGGRLLTAAGAALLLLGLIAAARADLYDARFDREHTGEVADWLRANTRAGDVIFVDQKYPFGFYYQPYTIPEPDGAEADGAEAEGAGDGPPARYLFVDINTVDARLSEWAGEAQRIFWLQWFESDTDPRHAVRFLLDKYGRMAGEQAFQGYLLQWWEMAPPTDFALAPDLQPVDIAFWQSVRAVEASLPADPLQPGDPLPVAIRWRRNPETGADGSPSGEMIHPGSLKARVALYDAGGARLAQADERLLNDRHRAPVQWGPDDQPLAVYLLSLPADLPAGAYSLGLLVYDADTLEAISEEATLGTIEIEN